MRSGGSALGITAVGRGTSLVSRQAKGSTRHLCVCARLSSELGHHLLGARQGAEAPPLQLLQPLGPDSRRHLLPPLRRACAQR